MSDSASPEILHLFMSRMSMTQYAFKNGSMAEFIDGKYATKKATEIAELTVECEEGHPTFYIDPEKKTITRQELDPLYKLREEIRIQERAKLLAAPRDMGTSDNSGGEGTGVGTTASMGGAAVNSGTSAASALQALVSNPPSVAKVTSKG